LVIAGGLILVIRLEIADPLEECLELGDPRLRARAHRLQDLRRPRAGGP
jgi:hypothetical protein